MAYRFDPEKPFDAEVRRLVGEQLVAAIDYLEQRPDGLHEAIHEARKKFKRVRAIYRLTGDADKVFRRRENARLRDAAGSLSAVRDATALVETTAYLQQHAGNASERAALSKLLKNLTERRDAIAASQTDLEERASAVVGSCRDAVEAIETQPFPTGHRKVARLLAKGWRRGLEKAQQSLEHCREQPGAESFHELRKAGQTYWMHLSLLRPLWPSAFAAKRQMVKQLVDLLGHEHDLSILFALLEMEPEIAEGEKRRVQCLVIIERQRAALQAEALALAEKVFVDPEGREADIVELLWFVASAG